MLWEEALVAAERIEVQVKLDAYRLSYRLLDGGPALLWDREQELRRCVSLIPDGEVLPVELGRDMFAWMNAAYMARRRLPGDLPLSWWGQTM